MRELRFRAFHKIDKRMGEVTAIDFPLERVMIKPPPNREIEEIWKWFNIELMQYTGLHDKTGKEIYEGDIVKVSDIIKLGKIIFESRSFGVRVIGGKHDNSFHSLMYVASDWIEVIGNIYENPELLKGEASEG